MKTLQFVATISLCVVVTTTAHSQATVDITKITCRQFLIGRVVSTKSIALWFSGYYNGKSNNTSIDIGKIPRNADKVQDYCRLHQDETVMKAVEASLGVK